MPQFLTKQPDGKFAIFSTIIDDFILTNAIPQEIIEYRISQETARISLDYKVAFDAIKNGKTKGYYAGNILYMTWEESQKKRVPPPEEE